VSQRAGQLGSCRQRASSRRVQQSKNYFDKYSVRSPEAAVLSVPAGSVLTDLDIPQRTGEEANPMPAPIPGPGPDDQQPPEQPGARPERGFADGLPPALDYQALLEAMAASGMLDCDEDDADAEFADQDAAAAEGRLLPADPAQLAAVTVEHMPPGPAQAGWLGVAAAGAGHPGRRRRRRPRMRPPGRLARLPAPAPAPRVRHRPGRHLPQPRLRPARLARRPRPHDRLGTRGHRRPDLRVQSWRPLPPRPHPQATPPLGVHPGGRGVPVDRTQRTHLHHGPRQPPCLILAW
jgi:hypothetical protein